MADGRRDPKQQRLDALETFRVKNEPNYAEANGDRARFNELVAVLHSRIKNGEYKPDQVIKLFGKDFEKVLQVAAVVNKEQVFIFGPHRTKVMAACLDQVYLQDLTDKKQDKIQAMAEGLIAICQPLSDEEKAICNTTGKKALIALMLKQYPGQWYHQDDHAREMREESSQFLPQLLQAAPLAELKVDTEAAMIVQGYTAQTHDHDQMISQHENELLSANAWTDQFYPVFADRISKEALREIAHYLIINGTLLSMHFKNEKIPEDKAHHVTLESVLLRIDREVVGIKQGEHSSQKKFLHLLTLLLSHFDISGWHAKTKRKQRELPKVMHNSFVKALTKGIREHEAKQLAGGKEVKTITDKEIEAFLPSAQGVIGQNGRMQFENKGEWPIFTAACEKARILALDPNSAALRQELLDYVMENIYTKSENKENSEKKGFNDAFNFSQQLGFASGGDTNEALKGLEYVCPEAAAIFRTLLVNEGNDNGWEIHASTFLPGLITALNSAKGELKSAEEKAGVDFNKARDMAKAAGKESVLPPEIQAVLTAGRNLAERYSEIIFISANQRGLEISSKDTPDDTKEILMNLFGMRRDEIRPELMDQYEIAYRSLIHTKQVQALFSQLQARPGEAEILRQTRILFDTKMQEIQAALDRARPEREAREALAAREAAEQIEQERLASTSTGLVVNITPPAQPEFKVRASTGRSSESTAKVLDGLSLTVPGQAGSDTLSPTGTRSQSDSSPRQPARARTQSDQSESSYSSFSEFSHTGNSEDRSPRTPSSPSSISSSSSIATTPRSYSSSPSLSPKPSPESNPSTPRPNPADSKHRRHPSSFSLSANTILSSTPRNAGSMDKKVAGTAPQTSAFTKASPAASASTSKGRSTTLQGAGKAGTFGYNKIRPQSKGATGNPTASVTGNSKPGRNGGRGGSFT